MIRAVAATAALVLSLATPAAAASGVAPVPVPPAGRAANTSHPDRWVGHGTAASCTSAAVVAAVRAGGIIRFRCGPNPVTIVMHATAKVHNTSRLVVLDGRGKVTLSGGRSRRILYLDTCDPAQTWTTSHCDNQANPQLIVQNMTFADGNSTGKHYDGGGGGAIFARGGQLRIVHSTFIDNRCDAHGPDLGGAAVRALSQYRGRPVYVTGSTFRGGVCSNGGGLSSIGVSWTVLNCRFVDNRAIGHGANPARHGTRGGGSGAAIYTDGDTYSVQLGGTAMSDNHANEGGGALFFVSNDRTGTLSIRHSTLSHNPSDGFHTAGLPGIFYLGHGRPRIYRSILR
jgi:hypothetical protein